MNEISHIIKGTGFYSPNRCKFCGNIIEEHWNYCSWCGAFLKPSTELGIAYDGNGDTLKNEFNKND